MCAGVASVMVMSWFGGVGSLRAGGPLSTVYALDGGLFIAERSWLDGIGVEGIDSEAIEANWGGWHFRRLDAGQRAFLIGSVDPVAVRVPLWMPFVLAAAGSAYLFWRDRPRCGAGRCAGCGYELAGLRGGVCPECGEEVRA